MWEQVYVYFQNVIGSLVCLFFVRIFIVYLRIHNPKKVIPRPKSSLLKLMIVLGSGGHTAEMFHLIKNISGHFSPKIYVVADTDILSEQKAKSYEEMKRNKLPSDEYLIEKIPRSREVGQSWISTIFTAFISFIAALKLLIKHKPDTLLCNGPGTCVPLGIAAFLLHVLGMQHLTLIYVESICRVKTMSLSGKILYYIADQFLVQWPELKDNYPRAKYLGKLI